jgi:hypothetical protein
MPRRLRETGGTPIEEAPLWALAILAVVLWHVAFPALVGLANGFGLWTGSPWPLAGAAAVLVVLLVAGLATRPQWRRTETSGPLDDRPFLFRFASWLWATLLVPNFLYGAIVLLRRGESLDYAAAWTIGLLVSAIHGALALTTRPRKR